MRILYGVAGEGMGHSTRSKVVIDHLIRRGHQVKVAVSGRAYDFLKRSFPDVIEIHGLRIRYVDGAMDIGGSVAINAQSAPQMLARNIEAFREVARFNPQLVITDLEPFAYLYAIIQHVPVISIDNHQVIPRCSHGANIVGDDPSSFRTVAMFVSAMMPQCQHYVATSFFYPPVRSECQQNTTLVPPILRDVVVRAKPCDGDHVLVYQTDLGDSRLLDTLCAIPGQKFIVYGLRRDEVRGNCVIKNFSEQGFVNDLVSARAAISNGGFSMLSEAVSLGKPVYSVPIRNQYEQIFNARYIAGLGYGRMSERFDPKSLGDFLRCVPWYANNLRSKPQHDGNARLYETVDQLLS